MCGDSSQQSDEELQSASRSPGLSVRKGNVHDAATHAFDAAVHGERNGANAVPTSGHTRDTAPAASRVSETGKVASAKILEEGAFD